MGPRLRPQGPPGPWPGKQPAPALDPTSPRSAHLCGPDPCCSRSPGGRSAACTGSPCLWEGPRQQHARCPPRRRRAAAPRPWGERPATGLDSVTHLLQAAPWRAGREAEGARPRTGRCSSPRQERGAQCHPKSSVSAPRPCHFSEDHTQGLWSHSSCGPGGDLGPGLTWAAARTFWYKLLPWRGSGGPVKAAGRGREGQRQTPSPPARPAPPHLQSGCAS